MKVWLCYKEYNIDLTHEAMVSFEDETGLDLWSTLMQHLNVKLMHDGSGNDNQLDLLIDLQNIVGFNKAAKLIHCLMPKEDRIPLDEVRDAMFRVGWRPFDGQNEKSECWPLVVCQIGFLIDSQMETLYPKKKADIKRDN